MLFERTLLLNVSNFNDLLALGFLGKQLEKALIQEDLRSANLLCLQEANMFKCIKVTGSGLTFSEIGVNDKRDFGVGLMKQELD